MIASALIVQAAAMSSNSITVQCRHLVSTVPEMLKIVRADAPPRLTSLVRKLAY